MRQIPALLVALTAFAALAGCGTKTPLKLPPPEKTSASHTVTCPQIRIPCFHSGPAPILVADSSSQVTESRL
ncbi:MAG: lipoprotein [Sulfuritalea sp.]|nr:lipoprotein [Sulfuritalea sp.]